MARINIEDEFWDDIAAVAGRMGDADKAAGQALRFIKFAQNQFKKNKPISYADFSEKFSDALMPEFARREGDTVVARGAGHFKWLDSKAEAGAKGGRSRSEAKTKHLKQNRSTRRSKTEATEASPSYSSSPSSSDSRSSSSSFEEKKEETVSSKPTKAGAFIVGYKSRFLERWGVSINVEGKDAGIAKRLAERFSFEDINTNLDAYFQMPDVEVIKKKHAMYLFEAKINEVQVFAQSGKFTSNKEAMQADDGLALNAQIQRIRSQG